MTVLLINGSPRTNGNTYKALSILESTLQAKGIETTWFQLSNQPQRGCRDCGGCQKTNRCVFKDDQCSELTESILGADGVIIGSPVYFAGPNGGLCSLLDRVFYSTCTFSQLFAGKPAAALVTCAWAGGTSALDRLNRYFIPSQMPIVTSKDYLVFQGDTIKRKEARSMELLQTLGENMAAFLQNTQLKSV